MRQLKRDLRREGHLPVAPSSRTEADGRIVDLAHPISLPQRYRLEWGPSEPDGERLTAQELESWHLAIVEDSVDGQRVYPEPPPHTRPVDRLARLVHRAPPATWLFVALALAQAAVGISNVASSGFRNAPSVVGLGLHATWLCLLALLPAAVLIWRRDAWQSARLVLGGAILWTTVPSVAALVRPLPAGFLAPESQLAFAWQGVMGGAAVVGYLGLLPVSIGLARVRRTRSDWLPAVIPQLAGVAALLMMYSATNWLPWPATPPSARVQYIATAHPAPTPPPPPLIDSIAGTALPLELLGFALLAGVCLSAILADEPQRRFWQCGLAGAAVLLGADIYQFSEAVLVGNPLSATVVGTSTPDWSPIAAAAAVVVGSSLMLLAFTSAVWSTARDAAPGRGAPDDIFSWGPYGWSWADPISIEGVVAVAAGADHGLALDCNGQVYAWGNDELGQADVPAELNGVVAIAAGDGFSLALRADGTVAAWGADDRGQTSLPADLADVTAIAAGHGFALALKSDGTMVGWGDESSGVVPVPALTGVTAISAGAYHALALRSDGTVIAWGDNSYGQTRVPGWLTGVKSISAGGDFSLALLADGRVAAWGDDTYGQLDVPEGMLNVAAISAGAFHAIALLAGGDVVAWGGGHRPGEADHPWRLVDFKAVAAGDGFSLAVRDRGTNRAA